MALKSQHVPQELLTKVTKSLGIIALDQWYYVSHKVVAKLVGFARLNSFGGITGFLKTAYPKHHFDEEKLTSRKNYENDQKFIEVIIRKLFPNTEIQTKARKAVGIVNPESDAYLEIDFWMPSLKLGIEYQDKHHYAYQWYANGSLEDYQKRDSIKKASMPTMGYTLITIGFWWDKTLESLVATIRKERPDLLQEYGSLVADPIPPDPPPGYLMNPIIPGISGLMSPFIAGGNFDPTNWYAGEKYDGVRGVYNPELAKMFSRSGKVLSLISSLLHDIPNMLVEGEITAGRGNYSKIAAVSFHVHHDKVDWPMFRYVLFDVPNSDLGNYTQRYSTIARELIARPFVFAQPVFRVLVESKDHLKTVLDSIIGDGGEGAIVQQDSLYEYGRATSLAKIKVRRDADAHVSRVNELSCTCKLVSGKSMEIPYCDDFDPSDLKIGDIVSYYHIGHYKGGTPRQAEIFKVRYDVTWDQLVNDKAYRSVSRRSVRDAIGSRSLIARKTILTNKRGHWNKLSNIRAFFDEFARMSGFDPLVPENWYSVRIKALRKSKGSGLLNVFRYNIMRALSKAYPELKFEAAKFRTHDTTKGRNKIGHWSTLSNIRVFFDDFAKKTGFDPLVPENWYPVSVRSLKSTGGGGLLHAYRYNLKNALKCAYSEVTFDMEKFRTQAKRKEVEYGHWNNPRNVRSFFDAFAASAEFDALEAENWYSVSIKTVRDAGGAGVLQVYDYNLKNALSSVYPEMKFEVAKFRTRKLGGK